MFGPFDMAKALKELAKAPPASLDIGIQDRLGRLGYFLEYRTHWILHGEAYQRIFQKSKRNWP